MPQVSLDSNLVEHFMRSVILDRVVANINAGQHRNHDDIFSPSQWNVDSSTRHTMGTSMAASGSTTGNTATVTLVLRYTISTI